MFIIIGLGNPGKKYEKTRHNIGWRVLDYVMEKRDLEIKTSAKFQAKFAQGKFDDEKIIFAKPQTFMNNSGEAVQAILSFYKTEPEKLIVVHDDKDIALGEIRVQADRGAAGHNGIKSIIEKLGTQNFIRVRVGIKPLLRADKPALNIVLEKFSKEEEKMLGEIIKKSAEAVEMIITQGLEKTMNEFN